MICIIVLLAFRFLRLGPAELGLVPDGRPRLAPPSAKPAARLSRAALFRDRHTALVCLRHASSSLDSGRAYG
jgi:hypothetical protein